MKRYKKPMGPGRFLSEAVVQTAADPSEYAFGFGRHIYPGKFVALNSLMLTCSVLLKIFDIEPIRNAQGREVPSQLKMTPNLQ
jgi:fumagillin biosynthesis cytochrome P450 monooxygenase